MTDDFEGFAVEARPRLRRALLGSVGVDQADDAVSEALAYAFENWSRVRTLDNPVGYLYRVGQSRSRSRRPVRLFREPDVVIPEVEVGLVDALLHLPESQRNAVWLVYGCDWSHRDVAEAMEISQSTVATHVSRGLERLRKELGVTDVVA